MSEGGILPPIVLELRAKSSELKAEMAATKKEMSELESHTSSSTSKMSGAFTKTAAYGKTLTVGIAGAAVAVGGFAIESAVAAQAVDAKLNTAVKNAGGNMEELDPKISKVDGTLRTFGFTNDQTNTALTTMTTALHDPEKALSAMGVAADLARAKNIDLNTASLMVAKAMEGQTRPLKALGIDLPVYAGGAQNVKVAQDSLATSQLALTHLLEKFPDAAKKTSKAHQAWETATLAVKQAQEKLHSTQNAGNTIMTAVEARVHGMASAYGDTLKGKIEAGKASVEAMGETLGKKLIPVVVGALGAAQSFVGWLGQHTPVLYAVAGVIGTVVVTAILAYVASLVAAGITSTITFAKMVASGVAWAATQAAQFAAAVASGVVWIAQHVAMAAVAVVQYGIIAVAATAAFVAENLATLGIIAGIALVVAAIVFLATHWTQVWGVIKTVVTAVWDWLKGVWSWISAVFMGGMKAGISVVSAVWHTVWGAIQSAVSGVWNFLKGVYTWTVGTFMAGIRLYVGVLGSVWGSVWGGIRNVVSSVWGFLSGVFGAIKSGVGLIGSALSGFAGMWRSLWSGIGSVLRSIYNNSIGPIVNTIKSAVSGVMSVVNGVGSVASSVGHFLGFANGGVIPGAPGEPRLVVAHGGEVVLSRDMLAGKQKPPDEVLSATTNAHGYTSQSQAALNGSGSSGGGHTVNVIAQTNASPHRIAADVGWVLRGLA